jgi:hypothetical protein
MVTLSVSTTAMTSSSSTASPAFLLQDATTADVILSPKLSRFTVTTEETETETEKVEIV